MTVVAPNTPTTQWIRDSGTVIEVSESLLADELGNLLVDENGANLLDKVSTDGEAPTSSWNDEDIDAHIWAESHEPLSSEYTRATVQGDTRTTVQGDTRISLASTLNRSLAHSWNDIDENETMWADSFEPLSSSSTRATVAGDTRVTVQGDTRVAQVSDANRQPSTSWSQDEY